MIDLTKVKAQLVAAKYWTMTGAVVGAVGFPLIEYLDNSTPDMVSVLIGASAGAVLGTGAGLLINAARDNKIENYVVAGPLIGMGGTMAGLKANPGTRHTSNKRLISNGLVGGLVGLTLGGGIDYLT